MTTVLTLRAEKRQERKEEREGVHFSERAFGTFQRSFRLLFAADPDQVRARMENGVLTVTLPKSQAKDRNRRIQIQGCAEGWRCGGWCAAGWWAGWGFAGWNAGRRRTRDGFAERDASGRQQAAGSQSGGQQADGQQAPGGYTTGSDGGTQPGSGPTGSGGDDQRPETTETMVPGVSGVSEDGAPGAL